MGKFLRMYSEGGVPNYSERLSDEEYRKSLRKFVKYCHDVIPVGPDSLWYLPARRHDRNHQGVWFVGGAVLPFIGFEASLEETTKRELSLDISFERFRHIGRNQYLFNEKSGLAHDAVCEIFLLTLSKEEIAQIRLDPDEYEEGGMLMPYDKKKIEAIQNPLTRQVFLDLWRERSDHILT